MAQKKELGWIWTSLVFGGIILICYLFVSTNSQFQVVYTQPHQNPGYEGTPAGITVYASAMINWGREALGWKQAGWIALALTPVLNFLAWKFDYKLSTEGTPWLKIFMVMGMPVLSGVLWVSSYSSKNDLGSYTGTFDKFKNEFQISDKQAALIQSEGGSGALMIDDENGKITEWFKAKGK